MKIHSLKNCRAEEGSTLVAVMVFIFVMGIIMGGVHSYTLAVAYQTAVQGEYLKANAAAEAAMETVTGRLIQWVTLNSGYGPSIADCATVGTTGNATFPAITGAVTFPAGSQLANFTVSGVSVYPVMPDDTIVTNTSDPKYLPNLATRQSVSENSINSVTRYYFSHSASQNAKNVASRSLAYKITVTVTPTLSSLIVRQSTSLSRYLRCDKVSPFNWCTYRMGSASYVGGSTYTGPMYLANSVAFYGANFTDSVLYGVSATNSGGTFSGGGYASQVKQTALLSMIPNLVGNLAVDSNGNRQASFETNTTSPGGGAAAPADKFSTREIIEPPSNPSNDLTPAVIRDARIYNQADVRIQVNVTTSGNTATANVSVVNVNGTAMSAASNPWITPLLAAINVKTTKASTPFYDRSRSTSSPVESTDINVGALKTVMDANPSVFPTGIIYVWDSTGLTSGTRPLTGVRLWNAGNLPSVGLSLGSNDPIYLKGDFNTGTTLPANATIDTSTPSSQPASNTSLGVNGNPTTEAQRTVSGYTILPGGVFGDSVTELSNAWHDANSLNTQTACNTTINLVEGWSTCSANELRSDDTYLDAAGRANPLWVENWSGVRRTMSGEEMVAWHSKYQTTTNEWAGGGWQGDISYDSKAASLKLNWGVVNFVRDRETRVY